MKIVFIVGGLEPGANGVGDYARLLAEEVCRSGAHQCALLALNDPFITTPVASASGESIKQLRLPSSLSWEQRMASATSFVDEFAPDWVSLQFVPYSFDKKGIVRGLAGRLKKLTAGRKVQVMFHELWIGEDQGSSRKSRLVGAIQRFYVLGILRALKPATVNTSNTRYLGFLKRDGVTASLLPIFGNIPVQEESADEWLFPLLQQQGIQVDEANRQSFWLLGFFGSLRAGWPTEPLFEQLRKVAAASGKKVLILAAGRLGNDAFWSEIEKRYQSDFTFIKLGEQEPERISRYLISLDAGIAISPLSIIGKSGAAAAMLDHGLPVIINNVDCDPAPFINNPEQPLVQPVDATFADRMIAGFPRGLPQPRLPLVAQTFLRAMAEAKTP